MPYLMKCGHIAQGTLKDGTEPVCAICVGLTPNAKIIERECHGVDGLQGRKAHCCYGEHAIVDSSWELPFFEYNPNCKHDSFYCGCFGWN